MKTNIIPLMITAVLILISCSKKENETAGDKNKPQPAMMDPMETVAISQMNPKVTFKVAGELKPDQRTELFAKVNSYVRALKADIGDFVAKGQVLAVLEAPEIQSQVASLKAKVEAQQAVYLSTKATYDRMVKANATRGAIAKDALDQITSRKMSDEAQLKAARSAYEEIKDVDNYLIIRAPFSGRVVSRNVDTGAYVGPMGKTPLFVIEDNRKLRLQLSIPEVNTPYVREGDTVRFFVRSQPQEKYFAIVSRKSGSLDERLRSEKIEADYDNTRNALKPHMIAESAISLQGNAPTFFVPRSAVVESGSGIYLIIVKNGKTVNVPVSKGRVMMDQVEVFGTLEKGMQVLKMGSEEIQEGTAIGMK